MTSAALLERSQAASAADTDGNADRLRRRWQLVAAAGPDPCRQPEEGNIELPADDDLVLALRGRMLPAEDRRVLAAFAAQAAVALQQRRLAEAAAEVEPLAEADRTRTAVLTAVSHDLRSPLASAKAAITSLRSDEVTWSDEEKAELLATADESLDRLTRLVENLLDMSRLQAGALSAFPRPVGLDDVTVQALDDLGPIASDVHLQLPDDLPEVHADPALLERVVANLVTNAVRHSPPNTPPLISASTLGDRVELRVVDHGPGVAEDGWDAMFVPFQRLGDHDNTTGVGLGLALSRALAEAIGGTLHPEHTPGGGLTMVMSMPAVSSTPPISLPAETTP